MRGANREIIAWLVRLDIHWRKFREETIPWIIKCKLKASEEKRKPLICSFNRFISAPFPISFCPEHFVESK